MSRVIVLGSINTDLVVRGTRLPSPGETITGGDFYRAQGGKGANQAVAAGRLSEEPVVLIGAVGDDTHGEAARHALENENLALEYLQTLPDVPSGVALILVDEQGENMISVASGANARLAPADVDRVPDRVWRAAEVFLACLESPLETVAAGIRRAKEFGLKTILNPAPACAEVAQYMSFADIDVLTPNETELGLMTGHLRGDPRSAAQTLCDRGAGSVVVTLGSQGCLLVNHDTQQEIPAAAVTAVDATGAGDAFNGALAVELAQGTSLPEAVSFANHAAAIAVTRCGAQPSLPTRQEVEALVAKS